MATVTDEVYRARVVKGWVFANHSEREQAAIRHFLASGQVVDGFPYAEVHASGVCWGEPRKVRGRQGGDDSPQPAVARVVVRRCRRSRSDGLNYEVLTAGPGEPLRLVGRMASGVDAYEYGVRVQDRLHGQSGMEVLLTAAV